MGRGAVGLYEGGANMIKYIIKRVLVMIPMLFGISMMSYLIMKGEILK